MAYKKDFVDFTIIPLTYTITTNEDNFDYTQNGDYSSIVKFINNTSSLNITGFLVETEGHYLLIYNSIDSTYDIVLKDDTTSDSANRLKLSAGDITLSPGERVQLIYLDDRWRD